MRNHVFIKLFLFIAVSSLFVPGAADDAKKAVDLKSILEPIRAEYHIPAMGACVLSKNEIVALVVVGTRKYGSVVRAQVDDRFHLGSCTKAFTATLIARLVEKGVLRWEETLQELFPELVKTMHPLFKNVTLEDLLWHRSGLPERSWPLDISLTDLHKLPGSIREQRILFTQKMLSEVPAQKPKIGYLYSNAGYVIAGAAAENATGKSWEALVKEFVFDPLGISSAGFGAMGTEGKIDEPWQHEFRGNAIVPVAPGPHSDNPAVLGPAGTINCSLTDWAKFVGLHLEGEKGRSSYLKPETFKRLHTPPAGQDYSMGWIRVEREWGGGFVYTHAGSNTRNWAVVWMAPERDFAVLVVCNLGGNEIYAAVDKAAGAIVSAWL